MKIESHLMKFKKNIQCPKCLSIHIKKKLVTICGPPEYVRWECLDCGYYQHMEPADAKQKGTENKHKRIKPRNLNVAPFVINAEDREALRLMIFEYRKQRDI